MAPSILGASSLTLLATMAAFTTTAPTPQGNTTPEGNTCSVKVSLQPLDSSATNIDVRLLNENDEEKGKWAGIMNIDQYASIGGLDSDEDVKWDLKSYTFNPEEADRTLNFQYGSQYWDYQFCFIDDAPTEENGRTESRTCSFEC